MKPGKGKVWLVCFVFFAFHSSYALPAFGKRKENQIVSHLSDGKRLSSRWMHPIRHQQKPLLPYLKCQPLSSNFAYQHSDRGYMPLLGFLQYVKYWYAKSHSEIPFWIYERAQNLAVSTRGMTGECMFLWCLDMQLTEKGKKLLMLEKINCIWVKIISSALIKLKKPTLQ